MNEAEFYVGYSPRAPRPVGRLMGLAAVVCVVLAIGLAAALSANQEEFAPSHFDFGVYRTYVGVMISEPVPMLLDGPRAYLLAGPGKHGISDHVRPMQGRRVEIRGSLAENGPDALIEVDPSQIRTGEAAPVPVRLALGPASLKGEIVDSKCHFGVMNPGRGKVHRDCAVRCISGGIPPALLVRNLSGQTTIVLLAGSDLARQVLPMVAVPVQVSGQLYRIGNKTLLETDVTAITRAKVE